MNQAISQLILNIRQHLLLVVDFVMYTLGFNKFAYKKVTTTGVYSRGDEEEGGCCGGDGDCC